MPKRERRWWTRQTPISNRRPEPATTKPQSCGHRWWVMFWHVAKVIVKVGGMTSLELVQTQQDQQDKIVSVSVDAVKPAPENEAVYAVFDVRNKDDEALYESVKRRGVLEALTVSADGFILSGHRRHWAAIIAKLEHVPIRCVILRLSDLPKAERLRVLTEHNTQRRKGVEEQAREEIVRASPEDAFRGLRERLAAKQAEAYQALPCAMRIEGRTARAEISEAKAAFLAAICRESQARRDYWPLSVRQLHYAMLNQPPLRHSGKRRSLYRNDRESYRAMCDLCARARLAGLIPWAAVADE